MRGEVGAVMRRVLHSCKDFVGGFVRRRELGLDQSVGSHLVRIYEHECFGMGLLLIVSSPRLEHRYWSPFHIILHRLGTASEHLMALGSSTATALALGTGK